MAEMVLERNGDREGMVARLFAHLAVQMREMDGGVREGAAAAILDNLKVLSGLAKTLEQLLTTERKVAAPEDGAAPDVEGLRARVMERLRSLRPAGGALAATPA